MFSVGRHRCRYYLPALFGLVTTKKFGGELENILCSHYDASLHLILDEKIGKHIAVIAQYRITNPRTKQTQRRI